MTKNDWKEVLVDVLSLQELAKQIWGDELLVPDDFGVELYRWQQELGMLATSKDPLKELKKWKKLLK